MHISMAYGFFSIARCRDVITGTRKNKPVPDQNKQVINHNTFLPMRENRVEVINNVPISLRFHQHARFAFWAQNYSLKGRVEKENDAMLSRIGQIFFRIFLGLSLKKIRMPELLRTVM